MFKNYLTSLFRNITRNKFYSTLNIIGLSIGIAAAILILLYVEDELSYDNYHEKRDRIYRIESDFTISGKHDQFAIVPTPMGPALKLEFPEVEEFVRFYDAGGNTLFRVGDKEYYEDNFVFTDSCVFEVFSYNLLHGDRKLCLTEPNTIVITEKIAEKYFGDKYAMGEMMVSGSGKNYKVTGIMEDLPGNSHLKFDALISGMSIAADVGIDEFNSLEPGRFWNIGVYTYIVLNKNANVQSVHDKFQPFYDKYMKPIGDQINASFNLLSTPLTQTHFRKGLGSERPTGNMGYILIFSASGIFLLVIASINYMNMATARSTKRAKEVGIRKVNGAYKYQLIRQFIGESVVLSVLAMLISIVIVVLLLPDFNNLADKTIEFSIVEKPWIFTGILIITLLVGLISGSYPAFYLSSFQPVKVLKGGAGKNGRNSGILRKVLVVIQFLIAIFMIIGTIVISGQIHFMKNKDMGFNEKDLIVMEIQDSAFRSKAETFKEELLNHPNISAVTNSTGVPGRINWIQVLRIEQQDKMEDKAIILAQSDYDYVETMELKIKKGRDFNKGMGTDALEAVIINETAAKEYGWEDDPIGKKIHYGWELDGSGGRMMKVIGVVENFHFRSMHNKIEPVIFFISERPRYLVTCRINNNNRKETINFIEGKWTEFNAKRPFKYEFLDNSLDEMYQAEDKIGLIITITTILTIFIALLGLLGLSSFIAEQRTKEIGIRKVVGASVSKILVLLYHEFAVLILIAFFIAVPVSWWRLDIWLNDSFIYHQPLHWITFLYAGILAFIIGMGTISFFIVRAASGNPVEAIKYE